MKTLPPVVLILAALAIAPASPSAYAGSGEMEPNDTKAQANVFALPAVSTPAFITGNSTGSTGTGLDYYRLTTAAQVNLSFYRHRLIIQTATPGHTGTLRGLTQLDGVIDPASDIDFQVSDPTTVPPRFVQWYTSQAPAEIYVRITGTGATTSDYALDYEVTTVAEVDTLPALIAGNITISTVDQTSVDTDLWVYDMNRAAIPDAGNDDEFNGPTLQSTLTRFYPAGTLYHVAISSYNTGNSLPSPADDDFRNGNVLDFPGAIANNGITTNEDVDMVVTDFGGPHPVSATKAGVFDVVFVELFVLLPVELMNFQVE
jgi:hypothetical protein